MTTPHSEQPAEGAEDIPADGKAPSNPDKTGDSIDSGAEPADKDRTESDEHREAAQRGDDPLPEGQGFAS